jgi:hypothetical protein
MQGLPRKLSVGLLAVVFLVSVYRARTQFFTVDEAFAFELFVNQKLVVFAQQYDACNHVLHTLLTKLFRSMFGITETALRLSSLLGCLLYLWAAYRVTLLCFGERWVQLLGVAVLTLNPLVMDFFVASRGYGLALAMLLWSFYATSRYWMCGRDAKWLTRSGVLAGLSIAANLTMLVPVAALGVVLGIIALRDRRAELWRVIDRYAGPAAVTAFVIVIIPLLRATRENFYYGARTLHDAVLFLVGPAAWNIPERWPGSMLRANFPFLLYVVMPVLVLAITAGFVVVAVRFLRAQEPLPYRLVPFLLFAGTLVFSVVAVLVLGQFGVPYPQGRTGIYFVLLLTFPLVLGGRLLVETPAAKLRWVPYLASILLVALYLTQFNGRYFAEWRYDAGTGKLLRQMQENVHFHFRKDRPPVLAISPILKSTVEYYRVRRRMDWFEGPITENIAKAAADYYIFTEHDRDSVRRLGLQVIVEDPVSHAVLARRRS